MVVFLNRRGAGWALSAATAAVNAGTMIRRMCATRTKCVSSEYSYRDMCLVQAHYLTNHVVTTVQSSREDCVNSKIGARKKSWH
jgi:hypothetical protein